MVVDGTLLNFLNCTDDMHPFQTFEEFLSGAGSKTNAPPPQRIGP